LTGVGAGGVSDGALILGIETSCDESSAAVVRSPRELLGHVVLSQDVHQIYGGVVPELAARAHLQVLDGVVAEALHEAGIGLSDLDAIAVTAGPGLVGALLVGVCWAKAVAFAQGIPLIPVHHMEGHLFAPSLEDPGAEPPFVALLASGGHTMLMEVPRWGEYILLGQTRDDAAGEAFDKVAKLLGLSYPGGPAVERAATHGNPGAFRFPTPLLKGGQDPLSSDYYDFSFSGLKTAVGIQVAELRSAGRIENEVDDVAASFQATAVKVLVEKTLRAVEETGHRRVLLGGGVSANSTLRDALRERLGPQGQLLVGSPRISVDNGAMVARAGAFRMDRGDLGDWGLNASPGLPFPGLRRRGEPKTPLTA